MRNIYIKLCWMNHKGFIKEMISNNKNKSSKELTLEQIIQKSKFRKNIDTICLLETKINKDLSKPTSLVHTPISAFNKPSEISQFQHFQSKRSIHSTHETHRKTSNSVTARTAKSYKQQVLESLSPQQSLHNNFKTITRDEHLTKEFKKSKQNTLVSLEKPRSLKSKTKTTNQFLCVKGASGNVAINMHKPMTAGQCTSRDFIPEYEMKKYQTVVQLGTQIGQKQKSQQLKSNNETIGAKKYHSFMVSKYTSSNDIRQKSFKSQSYSQSKTKQKIMMPEELIKKKIDYRGVKTQQKINSKLDNAEDSDHLKSKKLKKYELVLNAHFEQEIKKQSKNNKTKNQFNQKPNENLEQPKPTIQQHEQNGLDLISQKVENEQSPNQTRTKGFKGKKVKSTIQMKTRYFIPDFIKPSLDLIIFDKKTSDKVKTEERQTFNKRNDMNEEEVINRTFQQLVQGINGKQINTIQKGSFESNLDSLPQKDQKYQNLALEKDQNREKNNENLISPSEIEQQQQIDLMVIQHQAKNRKQKEKKKKKGKDIEDEQICAWNLSNHKNTQLYRQLDYDLGF